MRAARAIAAVELRRFLRDRSNIFFVFLFPLLLVLVIGTQFGGGGGNGRVAISGTDSALNNAITASLEDDDVTVTRAGAEAVRQQVARGRTDVGLFISPAAATAYDAGDPVDLEVVPGTQQGTQATLQRVRTAVAGLSVERGQVAALVGAGIGDTQARAALADAAAASTPPELTVVDVDSITQEFAGLGQFDLGAAAELLLFVFLTSLAGATTLIQTRRLGVMSRTLGSPVSTGQALAGHAFGRFTIALFQGAYIMLATAILFRVSWGNIWLSLLVLATFSAVAAGAAMLIGSLLDNDGAASGIGIGLGLVLGALGGCMLPLELFPDTLRTIAHVTPHAWAYDAFAQIQRHDGTLVDILPALGVLVAMAAVLLALGTWSLRRSMSRAL
ncbi:ABC transporter permease [Pengzhenrongella frigida]|uniref:ABC transporter permease n=1 Tax=Pengzhenrongella frigida TaxID=1259133 RepID=A0A4Q5MXV3_9MICO|nr:ABC transporter permease [Cellulomonas sp. HLT2-17]RYV49783.1 ABC transporter permease [Cellulomonas sp. HLT2-17]